MHGAEYPISTIVTVLDSLCIDNFSLFTVFSSVLSDGQHAVRPIGIIVYLHYLYIRPLNMSSAKISNLDNKERRLSSVVQICGTWLISKAAPPKTCCCIKRTPHSNSEYSNAMVMWRCELLKKIEFLQFDSQNPNKEKTTHLRSLNLFSFLYFFIYYIIYYILLL